VAVSPADVEAAASRIRGHVHRTPVVTCTALDDVAGARVFLKCEQLQRAGAFKFRGATNAVLGLSEAEAARGVACHSSGNHAQALALAARTRGATAHVVMPEGASAVKRAAVEGYGAHVVTCDPTLAARESTLSEVLATTGAVEVHPYDNDLVIAGQGTAARELLEDAGPLDVVLAPVGGGGLLAGTALAAVGSHPGTLVVGAEPAAADDAARSFRMGTLQPSIDPDTVADGLRAALSPRTFAVIAAHVGGIVTVDEAAIVAAMRFVWERAKLVIEPSAAVPVAALLDRLVAGERVGVILSGGNVDFDHLPWLPKPRD
jgi:threonine dehydratase